MTDTRRALPRGYLLKEYRIEDVLGFGGFGVTYAAQHVTLGKRYAIKEFFPYQLAFRPDHEPPTVQHDLPTALGEHTRDLSCEPDAFDILPKQDGFSALFRDNLKKFLQEAQTLALFRHPSITSVHNYFAANNTAYLVMDFEEGVKLPLPKRGTGLPQEEIESLLRPLLSGLEEIHQAGILHRDIKPDNIIIRSHGPPVLVDLGAARSYLAAEGQEMTLIGTPAYAPPEQMEVGGKQGPWTDLYALGAVVYRLIGGGRPPSADLRLQGVQCGADPLTPAVSVGEGRYTRPFLTAIDQALALPVADRLQDTRQWLDHLEHPPSPVSRPSSPEWHHGSPFPGLSPFEPEHAPVFFGREKAVEEVVSACKRQAEAGWPWVLLIGASGSGKSSLLRAGVLPCLTGSRDYLWRQAIFVPGEGADDPFLALALALTGPGALPELLEEGNPQRLAMDLRQHAEMAYQFIKSGFQEAQWQARRQGHPVDQAPARLLLILDQLEGLFLLSGVDRQTRRAFFQAINSLVRSGRVWTVAALRGDHYHRLSNYPELMLLKRGDGQYDLKPPTPAEVGRMIRLPAKAAGLSFDDEDGVHLDDVILEEAGHHPERLALLQFTLAELYANRTTQGVLPFAVYRRLGGIKGALAHRAEQVHGGLSPRQRQGIPKLFRVLVSFSPDKNEAVARNRVPREELENDPLLVELADLLIRERLLVADRNEEGEPVVLLAQEAMLTGWPLLAEWIRENRELIRIHTRVRILSGRWLKEGRHPDFLLSGGLPLAEAESLLANRPEDLAESERAFIESSRQKEDARRRQEAALALALSQAQRQASERLARLLMEQGRESLLSGRPERALEALLEARQHGLANDAALSFLIAQAIRSRPIVAWNSGKGRIEQLFFDPSGQVLFTRSQSGHLALFAGDSGKALPSPEGPLRHFGGFLERGRRFLAVQEDGTAGIWEIAQTQVASLRGQVAGFIRAALHGPQVALAREDEQVEVWNMDEEKAVYTFSPHVGEVSALAFSPDGALLLVGGVSGLAVVWGAAGRVSVLDGHPGGVTAVAWHPAGETALTGGHDGLVHLWHVPSGNAVLSLGQHFDAVRQLRFLADGRMLTFAWGRSIRLWSAEEERAASPADHPVYGADISANGTLMAGGCWRRGIQVWDTWSGKPVMTFAPRNLRVTQAAFHPEGRVLASGDDSGGIQLWSLPGVGTSVPLGPHAKGIFRAQFQRDGRRVVTVGERAGVTLWQLETGRPLLTIRPEDECFFNAHLSHDGQWLLTGSKRRMALWETETGRLKHDLQEPIHSFAPTPQGGGFALVTTEGAVKFYSLMSTEPEGLFQDHEQGVGKLYFSPGGDYLATLARDHSVTLAHAAIWEATSGRRLSTLAGHLASLTHLSWHPGGKTLVTASLDYTARVWDTESGETLTVLAEHEGVVVSAWFSPDGQRILTASLDGSAILWDAQTGKSQAFLTHRQGFINKAIFSPDGAFIATSGGDGVACLWDVNTGHLLALLDGHGQPLMDLSFSSDGKRLVTASDDGFARVWFIHP